MLSELVDFFQDAWLTSPVWEGLVGCCLYDLIIEKTRILLCLWNFKD